MLGRDWQRHSEESSERGREERPSEEGCVGPWRKQERAASVSPRETRSQLCEEGRGLALWTSELELWRSRVTFTRVIMET